MRLIIILFLLLIGYVVYSQKEHCERMYNEARKFADSGRYEIALNKLAAAKICNPEETKYDSLIIEIYKVINRQKEIAEEALEREKQAKLLESIAKKEAVKEKVN